MVASGYRRIPRTIAVTLGVVILSAGVLKVGKDLFEEQSRRKAMLANCIVRRAKLLDYSRSRSLLIADLGALVADLETQAAQDEKEGDAAAARASRRQAQEKRVEIRRLKRYEELLGLRSRYYGEMIRKYERGVRLPLSRLDPDPYPPPVAPEVTGLVE